MKSFHIEITEIISYVIFSMYITFFFLTWKTQQNQFRGGLVGWYGESGMGMKATNSYLVFGSIFFYLRTHT